ncbi:MAG TPA: DUF402 domain-containing protein, partial [Anaerolineales bacterium]|nr:DUF402 domain-containing protein [Anaerolineales bacterium]
MRGVWHHKLWYACPVIIFQDSPEMIALYWRAGTPNIVPNRRPTPHDLLIDNIHLIPHHWTDTDVLMLVKPGEAHSVNLMWEAGHGRLQCWYVDMLEPLRRTNSGFETMDFLLDVVISGDKSSWHWKDEDEFDEAVALGVFSPDEANAIRKEGETVIKLIQSGQSPFYDGWEDWRPPANWVIPLFPENWDISSESEAS